MDVERIQKVNNLALDLMKQGLASDREEAVTKAEEIFKERDTEDYANIRQTMEDVRPEIRVEEQKRENPDNLSQEKVSEILEKNTKFIVTKFKEFQEKITSLEREISFMKNRMLNSAPTVKEVVSQVKVESRPEQKKTSQEESSPEAKPENHPRSGNYKENDVSIEKFFYMGNK